MNTLLRGVLFGLAMELAIAAMLLLTVTSTHAQEVRREYLRVTYYTLPGRMASGEMVHRDAAACSQWLPFGTQLMFEDGYVVTCLDRGYGDWFWRGWLDVWVPDRATGLRDITGAFGDYSWLQVVRWGWNG